ncbi:MAG TPA: YgiT-type zinc finger protein [Flexilinea sp.]|nr:YgiT-type zinc finger protein [Flexilinea sp.]HNY20185.1 YgiT-type zinc finger protein [Flexilinea sp.]HOR55333.1 YgiT-type zinc finger protein [Flexilinea sp.]HOW06789.1 YgiT-type zinc finger protein [Flexilinea sp.]HPG19909.1 YgiT-type zinc finger protein [Flexilinea sp.]
MERVEYCEECQVGIPHFTTATYFTWIEDELITVPDFPCWVCDVCGRREWDAESLMNLNLILSPNAGKPQPRKRTITGESKSPRAKTRRSAVR